MCLHMMSLAHSVLWKLFGNNSQVLDANLIYSLKQKTSIFRELWITSKEICIYISVTLSRVKNLTAMAAIPLSGNRLFH